MIAPSFNCPRCGSKCTEFIFRAPCAIKAGRTLHEEYICKACWQAHIEAMEAVLGDAVAADPTICSVCAGDPSEPDKTFGPAGPHSAHLRPVKTGDWKTVPVCWYCFDVYHRAVDAHIKDRKGGR